MIETVLTFTETTVTVACQRCDTVFDLEVDAPPQRNLLAAMRWLRQHRVDDCS